MFFTQWVGGIGRAMTPFEQQQVQRIWAAVEAVTDETRSLERMHEMDASLAIEYFDRVLVADQPADDVPAPKPNANALGSASKFPRK